MSDDFISAKDKALFRQMMQDVTPLKASARKVNKPESCKARPVLKPKLPLLLENMNLSIHQQDKISAETVLSFGKQRISAKQFKLLKNGEFPIEATLDLHGSNSDAAYERLLQFIISESNRQKRCILLIHGKGGRHGEAPILKNLVYQILKQMPQVLTFHSAKPKHGGNGALYVLLKRLNKPK